MRKARSLNTVAEFAMTLQVSLQRMALDVVASCTAFKSVICCEERRLFARREGADGSMKPDGWWVTIPEQDPLPSVASAAHSTSTHIRPTKMGSQLAKREYGHLPANLQG